MTTRKSKRLRVARTFEPQYEVCLEKAKDGVSTFGLMSNQVWQDDPRRLTFVLARYKFVAKMLSGLKRVLEVGCADAFGTRIVLQTVPSVTAVDVDPLFVADVLKRMDRRWRFECRVHNMLSGPVRPGAFDAAYSMDVLEHIPGRQEGRFIGNMVRSLAAKGVLIIGSPSLESQAYASPPSKEGHVNCKTQAELRALMLRYFHNVFMFGMNDEVVHTGFPSMCHYHIAVCAGRKK